MPPTFVKKGGPKSHEEMRKSQCAVCFKRSSLIEIKPHMETMIQEVVSVDYSLGRDGLPVMICGACKTCVAYIFKVSYNFKTFVKTAAQIKIAYLIV